MGSWIAVIVVAVVAAAVVATVAVIAIRRGRNTTTATAETEATPRHHVPPAAPMTDLESALAQVTDRDGRPIRERIDAEGVHVDPLRDPDDTGPLLRRALDSVVRHDDEPAHDTPRRTDQLSADDPRPTEA